MPEFLYRPITVQELAQFYCAWIAIYMVIHLLWDICSKETERFTVERLQDKVVETFSAATFASSLYMLCMAMGPGGITSLGDGAVFPVILSAASGVIVSVGQMQPRDRRRRSRTREGVDTQEVEPA